MNRRPFSKPLGSGSADIDPDTDVAPGVVSRCVTPDGCFWHMTRKRPLMGREKLALQGVIVDHDLSASFGQPLEGDLAGNAFNAADFTVAFLGVLHALSASAEFSRFLRPASQGLSCEFMDHLNRERASMPVPAAATVEGCSDSLGSSDLFL
jgi:hypothetical protein